MFFFDHDRLQALAREHAAHYASAAPYPHAVIDDFLPPGVVEEAAAAFAALDVSNWPQYEDGGNTLKLATSEEALMPPPLRHLCAQFNSAAFVRFLRTLTGIDGLVVDPELFGGGLHQLNPGGFLRLHADFNFNPHLRLERRLNALLYLNPGWREEWGGAFELWPEDMSACDRRVAPLLNRLVVFSTTSTAYHGNPDPVRCPEGNARRSLAFFYYSNGRPEAERFKPHSTRYVTPGVAPEPPEPLEAPGVLSRLRRRTS